jgi:hypothetical protein
MVYDVQRASIARGGRSRLYVIYFYQNFYLGRWNYVRIKITDTISHRIYVLRDRLRDTL